MMVRNLRSIMAFLVLLGFLAGCQAMTGRTTGENIDDTTLTTSVKTALAKEKAASLTRIDDAGKIVPLEQLGISPQCGFSSTVLGNKLTVQEQIAKLKLIVEVAEAVWG